MLIEGRTLQGARAQLADFCSAPVAGFYAAVDILRLDQTTMWRAGSSFGYDDTQTRLLMTVKDAVEMGADAVVTYLFTCAKNPIDETRCFEICGDVNTQCRELGMPHVIEAMAANGGFAKADDPDVVSMNCRMAGELGADVIKTDWCGENGIQRAANQSIAPVCVAGGAKSGDAQALADIAGTAIASGATGVFFGRNVFQREDVGLTLRLIRDAMSAA